MKGDELVTLDEWKRLKKRDRQVRGYLRYVSRVQHQLHMNALEEKLAKQLEAFHHNQTRKQTNADDLT